MRSPLRIFIVFIEIIAGIGAVFAFYEIFLARKTVDHFKSRIELCEFRVNDKHELVKFLARNSDRFAYISLDLTERPFRCENTEMERENTQILMDPGPVTLQVGDMGSTHGYEDVQDFEASGNFVYLLIDRVKINDAILTDFNRISQEVVGYVGFTGLFFVDTYEGEGDIYFSLVPAPFDSQTEIMSRCTAVLQRNSGIDRIIRYLTDCIL